MEKEWSLDLNFTYKHSLSNGFTRQNLIMHVSSTVVQHKTPRPLISSRSTNNIHLIFIFSSLLIGKVFEIELPADNIYGFKF